VYQAPLAKKILQVIRVLAQSDPQIRMADIARTLSINKSTVLGILKALEDEGYVTRDPSNKKYSVGRELTSLCTLLLKHVDIATVARPFLELLADVVDETAFLGVRLDSHIKVVDVAKPQKGLVVSSSIGMRLPLTSGAPGKAVLASMPDAEVFRILRERDDKPRTAASKHDTHDMYNAGRFMENIRNTRRIGYALDLEEHMTGVRSVAVPLISNGQCIATLWVAGFSASMTDDKLMRVVRHLKNAASVIAATAEGRGVSVFSYASGDAHQNSTWAHGQQKGSGH
jgi:DNA-binding IclR family transcriptional regulator